MNGEGCFIKQCRDTVAFRNELLVYRSGFPHRAKLQSVEDNRTLRFSLLPGKPYADQPFTARLIRQLALVISSLHKLKRDNEKVLCHWDNQPCNLLWDAETGQMNLVDFSDIRLAPPEADICHLFLFWAEWLTPADLRKWTGMFLHSYTGQVPLSTARWKREYCKAKRRFDARRHKHGRQEAEVNPDRQLNRKYLSGLNLPCTPHGCAQSRSR